MSANLLLSVDSSNIVRSDEKTAMIELEITKDNDFSYLILDNLNVMDELFLFIKT